MRIILNSRSFYILGAGILILLAILFLVKVLSSKNEDVVTSTVTRGDVIEIVSVSGVVESESTAKLTFPVTDIVSSVNVKVGDTVAADDVLVALAQNDLLADRQDASAALEIARANRDELIAGPRSEERDITDTTVKTAEAQLARTIEEENEKVENARRALNSIGLEALPERASNSDTAPTVTGTYICEEPGIYYLDIYQSSAKSGYSYRLSGLEVGIYNAYTESPTSMGACGLKIEFAENVSYGQSDWTIEVPNTNASTYSTNLNAYELAQVVRESNIEAAEEALEAALKEATLDNATPREEALRRANAEVNSAAAKLARVNAFIEERTLRAPFDGIITDVNMIKGESADSSKSITIVGDNTFDLAARIPEIDIAKLEVEQVADVIFDARSDEIVSSEISFISPLALEIDGVAYFEAKLMLPDPPAWLREGLNADIDIVVEQHNDVLRVPSRFVTTEEEMDYILVLENEEIIKKTIETGFVGNDGFVEVIGLNEGDVVVAP